MKSVYSMLETMNRYDVVKLLGFYTTTSSCSGEIDELWFFIEAEIAEILISKFLSPKQLALSSIE